MLFPGLLNHWIEMTPLFMDYSAAKSIQCPLKILTFTILTVNLNTVIVTLTKHLLKHLDKLQNWIQYRRFPS